MVACANRLSPMADIVSPEVRSRMMAGIRGKNTKPELAIRRALHKAGFRYRLHCRHIPGKPDLTFSQYKAVVFVHGCFWHGHDCELFRIPQTRSEFWARKIASNRARDIAVLQALRQLGWRTATVWECAFRGRGQIGLDAAVHQIINWLPTTKSAIEIRGIADVPR